MPGDIIKIGSNCIIELGGDRAFLLTEIEAKVPGVEIDPIVIVRLTRDQARRLAEAGEPVCTVSETIPESSAGVAVEFKCIFIAAPDAFLIFDVENATDEAVLVPIGLSEARDLVKTGVRACTMIQRPFV